MAELLRIEIENRLYILQILSDSYMIKRQDITMIIKGECIWTAFLIRKEV